MGALIPVMAATLLAVGPVSSPTLVGAARSVVVPAGSAVVTAVAQAGAVGLAADEEAEDSGGDWHERGSLVGYHTLAPGSNGLRVSGGFALALPFVGFEYGRGFGDAQLQVHYEGVVGLLHFVDVGARWAPLETGRWRLGLGLTANYSFFGLASDNTSLASTLYLTPELGGSVYLGDASELILGAGIELDLLEWVVIDGEEETDVQVRVDAALVRFGWRTRLAEELDVYVLGRVRIPTETFEVDDEQFSFVPYAEFGGTWSF